MSVVVQVPVKEKTLMTGEELFALGDIGPCELVEGVVVKMSPTGEPHGVIEGSFYSALNIFVRQKKLGRVSVGEVGIYVKRNPDTVRGADVAFISNARIAKRGASGFMDIAPDLVVEILSPDDRMSEMLKKLEEYFSIGVRLVWVVDPETESVYAYRSLTDVRHFKKNDSLPGDEALPGFAASVAELFAS